MSRSPDEIRLAGLNDRPRAANSRPAFTVVLPSSPQVPTPNREFLLETPIEGVSSVATVAKLAGWDTRIRDLRIGEDFEDVCRDAASTTTGTWGFFICCASFPFVQPGTRPPAIKTPAASAIQCLF